MMAAQLTVCTHCSSSLSSHTLVPGPGVLIQIMLGGIAQGHIGYGIRLGHG